MRKLFRSTSFLMGINILVLGLFLWFWLHSEYRNEKSVLMQEAGLAVAERIMMIGGVDLDSLLLEFREAVADTLVPEGEGKRIIKRDISGSTRVSSHLWKTDDRHLADSMMNFSKVVEAIQGSDSMRATYSIVISDDHGGSRMDSMNVTAMLRDDYLADTENIARQALRNIRPQIGFAALLFALSMLAIYLLQRLFLERQQALQSKNIMISNITHELKTPVATIGVALEAIQDFDFKSNPDKTQAYLQTSRLELARLSGLIDQILQFGRIDQGAAQFDLQNVSLSELLQEAASTLRLQAEAKQARIAIDTGGQEFQVRADRLHLKSAFINLIDNSLKYGPEGVVIQVKAQQKDGDVQISFTDNGPGIPKAFQEKVFERFFRVPQGDTHNVKGSGLGLSYVAEVIRAHGGRIQLESEPGADTIVTVQLNRS